MRQQPCATHSTLDEQHFGLGWMSARLSWLPAEFYVPVVAVGVTHVVEPSKVVGAGGCDLHLNRARRQHSTCVEHTALIDGVPLAGAIVLGCASVWSQWRTYG